MIEFTRDMRVGIPHIDTQHEELVEFVNKTAPLFAAKPSKEEVRRSLGFLAEYVTQHFGDEEKLQQESDYPRYRQHKQIHDEFVGTYISMCEELERRGPSEELCGDIIKRVSNWIVTHIKLEDVRFGEHYAAYSNLK